METVVKRINGFKPEEIVATVQALQNDPSLAYFQFRVRNKWISGGHNRSTVRSFYGGGVEDTSRTEDFVFNNGEPPVLLGNNEGANPVEFILHALAGCMTTTMVLHAAAKGIELKSVESELKGDLDVQGFLGLSDQVRNGYREIQVKFKVDGDITDEQKETLISFAQNSPVFDVVTNPVPVKITMD